MEALEFAAVVRVAVVPDREPLLVRIVARVDTDLLHVLDGLHRRLGQEMDVGDERHRAPSGGGQTGAYVPEAASGLDVRCRDPDNLAPDLGERDGLPDGRLDILVVTRRHRLYADGIRPADADGADADLARKPADRVEARSAVGHPVDQGLAAAGAAVAAA